MSARDTNFRLVVHAKVFSLPALPALNVFKREKKKDLSMKLILTMGAPWNVFKNLAENVLIPYTKFLLLFYINI